MTPQIWVRWYIVRYGPSFSQTIRNCSARHISYLLTASYSYCREEHPLFSVASYQARLLHFQRWELSPALLRLRERSREREAAKRRNVSLQLMNVTGHEWARIRENKWKANKVTRRHGSVVGRPKKYIAVTVKICIDRCRRIKTGSRNSESVLCNVFIS